MITLEQAKLHLRVDIDDDDSLITSLIATAQCAIESHLDNPAIVLDSTAPAPLKSAALLLVGNMYENRTSLVDKVLHSNDTYDLLLNPYRVMCA